MREDSAMPRWLVALAVGAPLTIAIGYYYYRRKTDEELTEQNGSVKPKISKKSIADDLSPTTAPPALPHTPLERVLNLKNSGNEMFKSKKMEEAIKCYSEALSICPPEETDQMSVLYQNRAACYEALNDMDNLMKDINQSLELNPKYLKALNRRYKAAEKLQQYRQCVEDITTVCFLEKFSNIDSLTNVDRILKIVGAIESKEAVARRVPSIPSSHFIKSYFASFSHDPVINSVPDTPLVKPGDAPLFGLEAAKLALAEERYGDIVDKCTEQIVSVTSVDKQDQAYYEALLLRASLHILKTDYQRALADIGKILEGSPENIKIPVNALVKRASLHLQLEDEASCLRDFETAISMDPTNPDIYHHRGQIYMILDKMDESLQDFDTAYKYNPDSVLLAAQRLYTSYRHSMMKGKKDKAEKAVEELKQLVDQRKCVGGEAALLLAQIYLDQQNYECAEKSFNKSLEDDPKNATILVHKGLLELQWHQDINKAVDYMERAIQVDKKLEFAYETLATVEVQRGQMERAISLFEKALTLSRGEREIAHICALKAAAETQLKISERLGLSSLNVNSAL